MHVYGRTQVPCNLSMRVTFIAGPEPILESDALPDFQ